MNSMKNRGLKTRHHLAVAIFILATQVAVAAESWTISDSTVVEGSATYRVRNVNGGVAAPIHSSIFSVRPVLPAGSYRNFSISSADVAQTFLVYDPGTALVGATYLPDVGLLGNSGALLQVTLTMQPLLVCVGPTNFAFGPKLSHLASQASGKVSWIFGCPGRVGIPSSIHGAFSAKGRKS